MIRTRAAGESDYQFLWDLHKQTFRTYVQATWGWNEDWQGQNFRETRDLPDYEIIVYNGRDIGCIRVNDKHGFLFLDYIAILPEYQNNGLGTQLVQGVLSRAAERGVAVRLHVLKVNPARKLYERMGFQITGGDEFRHFMEAYPPKAG